jgi:purine-binding chemotaxis protein CheW
MSTALAEQIEVETQMVAFHLAGEIYGMDIAVIHEIILVPEITHIPRTSPDMQGVINLRGKIVPVLDLRKRLHLPAKEATRQTRIIVAEQGEMSVGMVVDDVVGVIRIAKSSIEPPTNLVTSMDIDSILGIGKHNDELIILLNMEHVLAAAKTH